MRLACQPTGAPSSSRPLWHGRRGLLVGSVGRVASLRQARRSERAGPLANVRRSRLAAHGYARLAPNPANAILNYLYAILEAEATIAARVVGLDPGLGLLHADQLNRDSLSTDLMEPVRHVVDRYVFDLLARRRFAADDFFETPAGCLPGYPTARSGASWRRARLGRAVGRVAEDVARRLEEGGNGRPMPTPVSGRNRSAGRAGGRGDGAAAPRPLRSRGCTQCGGPTPPKRRTCGQACDLEARAAQDRSGFYGSGPGALARLRAAGSEPDVGTRQRTLWSLAANVGSVAGNSHWPRRTDGAGLQHPEAKGPNSRWSRAYELGFHVGLLLVLVLLTYFLFQWVSPFGPLAQVLLFVVLGFYTLRAAVALVLAVRDVRPATSSTDRVFEASTASQVGSAPAPLSPRDRVFGALWYVFLGFLALAVLHLVTTTGFASESAVVQLLGLGPVTLYLVYQLVFNLDVAYLVLGPIARTQGDDAAAELTAEVGEHFLARIVVLGAVLTEVFAGWTAFWYERGVLNDRIDAGGREAFAAAERLYLWHLSDAIPFLKIPETLRWAPEPLLDDWRVGALVLGYKVIVLVPVVAAMLVIIRGIWWRLSRASGVDTSQQDG
jgi:hypothetical protein